MCWQPPAQHTRASVDPSVCSLTSSDMQNGVFTHVAGNDKAMIQHSSMSIAFTKAAGPAPPFVCCCWADHTGAQVPSGLSTSVVSALRVVLFLVREAQRLVNDQLVRQRGRLALRLRLRGGWLAAAAAANRDALDRRAPVGVPALLLRRGRRRQGDQQMSHVPRQGDRTLRHRREAVACATCHK